jgi:hypothetical protein
MTIVAAYRIDDRAIFLSDFRNTSNGTQTDVSLKFINIGNDIGLFLSGDALFWKNNLHLFQEVSSEVTFTNVLEMDGPLYEAASNAFWNRQPSIRTRAIGFIIDNESHSNKMFWIDMRPGIGVQILPIDEGRALVIGSGALLKNIDARINERIRHDREIYGDDLYKLASCMREEVQQTLVAHGFSSFRKLGISPYMAIHSLADSHFMIRGENIQGEVFTERTYFKYNYSFVRDEATDKVIFIDHINDTHLFVNDITNLEEALEGDLFDPQQLAAGFDPEEAFPNHNFVYLFHQWVIENEEDNTIDVYRSIKRINFNIINNTSTRLSESTSPVIAVEEFSSQQLAHFPDCRDQFFVLSDEDDNRFMEELNEARLFDHQWLSSYINEYFNIFFIEETN